MRKAAGATVAAVADVEGGASRGGPVPDKSYHRGGLVVFGVRITATPRNVFLAGMFVALVTAFVVVPGLIRGDDSDPLPSLKTAHVPVAGAGRGKAAATTSGGARDGRTGGVGGESGAGRKAGGGRSSGGGYGRSGSPSRSSGSSRSASPGRSQGGVHGSGGAVANDERAKRNEVLSLLTSADGEFNEAEEMEEKSRGEKPAEVLRLGQVTTNSKEAAEAIKEGSGGVDPINNQTLMKLLMEGITMPRNGKWPEANVKSILVHHPAAGGVNTNKEEWTNAGRAAAATVDKLFSKDGAKTLLDVGCLPDKDYAVRRRTCAVVGNGGVNLLDPHQGRAIDSADIVIRFNDGPTASFERFVGRKTTFRLINNQWSRHVSERGAVGAWAEGVLMCFGNGARRSFEDVCKKQTSAKIVFMHPDLSLRSREVYRRVYQRLGSAGLVHADGRNAAPSGIEGLTFAAAVCDRVHVYGFHTDVPRGAAAKGVKYHYHDNVHGADDAHSFNYQGMFLNVLEQIGYIRVCSRFNPEDTPKECKVGG